MPIRDHRIDVRFTETEKDAVGCAARSKGYKSASAMIRDAVQGILRPGIDVMTDRRLAIIELLLTRLNAKLQQLIFLRLGESQRAELSVIATDVAQLSTALKTELQKLKDLPRGQGHETAR